jgi:tetratricopeptide (TPR) repeat protein
MDRQKDAAQSGTAPGKKRIAIFALTGVLAFATAGYFYARSKASHGEPGEEHSEEQAADHGEKKSSKDRHAASEHGDAKHAGSKHDGSHGDAAPSIVERVTLAASSIQEKVDALRYAEQQAERLMLENANLRLKLEAAQLDCRVQDAAAHAKGVQSKLLSDTQTKLGRTLASISYKPPGHLFPYQLHTLGVNYFSSRDDEKAAVIFTFLTNLDDQPQFKSAKDLLMTGVAWYRVDNFELAEYYFEKVLSTPTHVENLKAHAQARLWKGLVAERVGKHRKSQALLREILDNHPRSIEARWINPATRGVQERHDDIVGEKQQAQSEGAHRDVAAEH